MSVQVRVFSRAEVEAGSAAGSDAVISIRGTGRMVSRVVDAAMPEAVLGDVESILVLRFDDIGIPDFGRQQGPTDDHAASVLDFARAVRARAPGARIAVHCEAGRSRSAAVAIGILADELGSGREAQAVAQVLGRDVEGHMSPNPRLIRLFDVHLWRYGSLDAALQAACPAYVAARAYWDRVMIDPAAALKARAEARRRPRCNEFDQDLPFD